MRTQSIDTHPEAERVLISLIRAASSQKRFHLIQSLTRSHIWTKVHHWQGTYPVANEREAAVLYSSSAYGKYLATRIETELQSQRDWQMQTIDLLAILQPALQVFEHLNIRSYLGGSIASSLHGMQQLAQDIDLVIELPETVPSDLLTLLRGHYIFDEPDAWEALQQHRSFSCIHLNTLQKIDVIVPQAGPFDAAMSKQIASCLLDEQYPPLQIASATEMIVWKLYLYQQHILASRNGMLDDATWNDILGMLKVQGSDLDRELLDRWAEAFDLSSILTQALIDSGYLPDVFERQNTAVTKTVICENIFS